MRYAVLLLFAVRLLGQHAPTAPPIEAPQGPAGPPPKFFIQGSDPQFGMYTKDANFLQETANFEFFIASINRLKPQFVVITGDLTNKPADADQIAEYHRIARKMDPAIKLYNVAGNHDVRNEPTPQSLALYRKNWGPDYYTFDSGDLRGIVLDTSLIQAPVQAQQEADKQEQWLKRQLAKAKSDGKRIVIFGHIPFFLKSADEADQYFNIPKQHRARYLALFHQYGVQHVFTGHYHRNAEGRDGDLDMVVTGPIGMPIGPDPSGFRIVTLDKFEHPYIRLGNIPNQVTAAVAAGK
jgi:serine/threonine-protein phosphatase CPPED1